MIKELIEDLAYDKIQLSQALSRSKIIGFKIKNDVFKEWLRKELEGYDYLDNFLPSYRIINCQMFITHALPNGQKHSKPLVADEEISKEFYDLVNNFRILNPISVIEDEISPLKDVGYIQLSAEEAYNFCAGDRYREWVVGGYRKVGKSQFQNVIELTKQKLLDTLLELNDKFPDITNEFDNTKSNMEKVQNIITNNIYGNNNPFMLAAGLNIEQKDNSVSVQSDCFSELEKLGVQKEEVQELKEIVKAHEKDKPTLKDKLLKWLGSVSASVAGRGLYDNLSAIGGIIKRLSE